MHSDVRQLPIPNRIPILIPSDVKVFVSANAKLNYIFTCFFNKNLLTFCTIRLYEPSTFAYS